MTHIVTISVDHLDSRKTCEQIEGQVYKESKIKMSNNNGIRKKVINIETNEIYCSIEKAALSINIKANTLAAQIARKVKNCKFKYYE